MTVGQLQQRHVEVFGEADHSRHKQYLIRRIAWRLTQHFNTTNSTGRLMLASSFGGHARVPRTATRRFSVGRYSSSAFETEISYARPIPIRASPKHQ
jgi:hypothetical protein